jgi:type VI secretion system protein VasI
MRRISFAVAALICVPAFGQEQSKDLKSEIERCRSYDGDSDRLACFDFVSGRKAPAPKPDSAAIPKSKWDISEDKSKLDGSRTTVAVLPAAEVNIAKSFGEVSAFLVLRCSEKRTSAYVSFGNSMVAYGRIPVSYRVGKKPPTSVKWPASQDYKAYGPFDSQPSIALIKDLMPAEDFFVRGHSDMHGTSEAYFKLEDIAAAVQPIRENCGW